MTTSTFDRTDLDRWLDDSPSCENPEGCDRAATCRLWWRCGCRPALSCDRCAAHIVVYLIGVLMCGICGQLCLACGVPMHGRSISDFVEVRPL